MKKMLWRYLVYGGVLLLLFIDLKLCGGPVSQMIGRAQQEKADRAAAEMRAGLVARVFHEPVSRGQVDRLVLERLYLQGRRPDTLTNSELKIMRTRAIWDIVDEAVLRTKIRANLDEYPINKEAVAMDFLRFVESIGGGDELEGFLKQSGFEGEKELRYRFAARRQQVAYLEAMIAPSLKISDEAVRSFYEENRSTFHLPKRVLVRHVFIEVLDRGVEAGRERARRLFSLLQTGEVTFETLAREESDDPRAKKDGGDLGWIANDGRIEEAFATQLLEMEPREVQIIQSELGFHLAEVVEVREPRTLKFEEVKDEIRIDLQNRVRPEAVMAWRMQNRARHQQHIQVYFENLHAEAPEWLQKME